MNKKKLAIALSKLKKVTSLNPAKEQYQTESELAADFLWLAYTNRDIENKIIADLGSGNGILGIGALLLGAKFVYFLESEASAQEIAKENVLASCSEKNYEFISQDISLFNKNVDTVIMNPPFGVQKRKADKVFLEKAMKHTDVIYSMHKIESEQFINALCKERKFKVEEIVSKTFNIKKSYKFHAKPVHSFNIGFWVLKK